MPDPHKGISTQCTNQQVLVKPRHQPSERDQQARERLRQKAKIKSHAYIQLGEKVLQTVHQTFEPEIPVILHLLALANTTIDTDTVPPLYVIQDGINCMPTTDYFFTSIKPGPIVVTRHRAHHSKLTSQQAATQDQVSQQTHPLQSGETRVYPSMLADKQVPVLNLTKSSITSQADLQDAFQSFHMVEKKAQKIKTQSDYLSDSKSSEDEINPHLRTSKEERVYGTRNTGSIVLYHHAVQPNGGKRTVETAQDKETFQRTGIRQNHTEQRKGKATVIYSNFI